MRGRRRHQVGIVIRAATDKTAKVAVTEKVQHPRYGKFIKRTKRYLVHDELNQVKVGDSVDLVETRPISKMKFWRIASVITSAPVVVEQ